MSQGRQDICDGESCTVFLETTRQEDEIMDLVKQIPAGDKIEGGKTGNLYFNKDLE